MIPYDPRFLDLERWSALTAALILPLGFVGTSTTKENWQHWGQRVRQVPALAGLGIPDPEQYDDWQDWAHRLNEALRTAPG